MALARLPCGRTIDVTLGNLCDYVSSGNVFEEMILLCIQAQDTNGKVFPPFLLLPWATSPIHTPISPYSLSNSGRGEVALKIVLFAGVTERWVREAAEVTYFHSSTPRLTLKRAISAAPFLASGQQSPGFNLGA